MILGVAPCFDQASSYSFDAFMDVIGYCDHTLLEDEAVREQVEYYIKVFQPKLFVFYDHGEKDRLIGNDKRPVIDLNNAHLLKNTDVYTLACLSAKKLGRVVWSYGRKYWGYDKVVGFTVNSDWHLFKRCFNAGLHAIMEGKSWEEAYEIAYNEYSQAIMEAEDDVSAMWLLHDRDCLRVYTPNNPPPEPKCPLRRFAIKLFGKLGWRIRKTEFFGHLLTMAGAGMMAHDFIWKCQEVFKMDLANTWIFILGAIFNFLGFVLTWADKVRWFARMLFRKAYALILISLWGFGFGLMIHDYFKELSRISNPYTVHGMWWGLLLQLTSVIAYIMLRFKR